MNDYKVKLNVEPEDKYEKARIALVEAKVAFDALTSQERLRFIKECIGAEALCELVKMMQQYHK